MVPRVQRMRARAADSARRAELRALGRERCPRLLAAALTLASVILILIGVIGGDLAGVIEGGTGLVLSAISG